MTGRVLSLHRVHTLQLRCESNGPTTVQEIELRQIMIPRVRTDVNRGMSIRGRGRMPERTRNNINMLMLAPSSFVDEQAQDKTIKTVSV